MELIPKNWIHLFRAKTSQESFLNVFYFNKSGTRKSKNLPKYSTKEISFTLQNNNENYNKPFKFISWRNHTERNPVLSPKTWSKIFANWFKKCSDGYIFSICYTSLFISPYL